MGHISMCSSRARQGLHSSLLTPVNDVSPRRPQRHTAHEARRRQGYRLRSLCRATGQIPLASKVGLPKSHSAAISTSVCFDASRYAARMRPAPTTPIFIYVRSLLFCAVFVEATLCPWRSARASRSEVCVGPRNVLQGQSRLAGNCHVFQRHS